MATELQNSTQVPAITGSEAFLGALVVAGASQSSAVVKIAPVTQLGQVPRLYINAPGRDLTLADTRGGVITSTGAGNTALLLPNFSTAITVSGTLHPALGFTRNGSNPMEISFLFQRTGTGSLFVNPVDSSVTIYWNNLDPQYLPAFHPPVMLTTAGDNIWFAH